MAPMKSGQKADGVVIVVTCMCPSIHKHVCVVVVAGIMGLTHSKCLPQSVHTRHTLLTILIQKKNIKLNVSSLALQLTSHICLNAHADWHILERALDLERHVLLSSIVTIRDNVTSSPVAGHFSAAKRTHLHSDILGYKMSTQR